MSAARDLWSQIPERLSHLAADIAYDELIRLAAESADAETASWLKSRALAQAASRLDEQLRILPSELKAIASHFTSEPRTEAELFEQVKARLLEIAESVQKGPFSERDLFPVGIPEKHLQNWLAARLDDTPRRRFTSHFVVSREPTVDRDKRTDIEVSTKAGKVCIEIKPLDCERRYSASSLVVDTLERQVLKQYLRGRNSSHAILVLFRLDRKLWEIPGLYGRREFLELVEFLKAKASEVVAVEAEVKRLDVIAIDCVYSA